MKCFSGRAVTVSLLIIFLTTEIVLAQKRTRLFSDESIRTQAVATSTRHIAVAAEDGVIILEKENDAWIEKERISPTGYRSSDAISISEKFLVIGGDSLFVFEYNGQTWINETSLDIDNVPVNTVDPEVRDVAVDANRIAATVRNYTGHYTLFVFAHDGSSWMEEAALTTNDGYFEYAGHVAISGDVAVVENSRSAEVFRWDGSSWGSEASLPVGSEDGANEIAIEGNYVAVGAYRENAVAGNTFYEGGGAVYIYFWSGGEWIEDQKLVSPDPTDVSWFGRRISISDRHLAVTARSDSDQYFTRGNIGYLYRKSDTGWILKSRISDIERDYTTVAATPVVLSTEHLVKGGVPEVFETGIGTLPAEADFLPRTRLGYTEDRQLKLSFFDFGAEGTDYTISKIFARDPDVKVSTPVPISIGEDIDFTIDAHFTPTEPREYNTYIVFEHDGPGGSDSIRVAGQGVMNGFLWWLGTQTVPTNFVNVLLRSDMDISADYLARELGIFNVYDNDQLMSPTSPESFYQVLKISDLPYRLRTVLLLDNSTSVANDLPQIREAARTLVDNIASNQEVAIYAFSGSIQLVQDFTGDRDLLYDAIENIDLGGPSTALHTSLLEGLAEAEDRFQMTEVASGEIDIHIERGFVVVLSDGNDTAGGASLEDVINARGQQRVFAVGYGEVNTEALQAIGNAGFYSVDTSNDLSGAFAEVQESIESETRRLYVLNYSSPRRASQENRLRICVVDPIYGEQSPCAQTTYNSSGFSDPVRGVFVNRSLERLYGIDEVNVPTTGVTLTATTILGINEPSYEWSSSDPDVVTVNPVEGTNQAVAQRLTGGDAVISVYDSANNLETSITASYVTTSQENLIQHKFGLRSLFPNPAREYIQIELETPTADKLQAEMYDVLGRSVMKIDLGPIITGTHEFTVDVTRLSTGLYFLRVTAGGSVETRSITVVQ